MARRARKSEVREAKNAVDQYLRENAHTRYIMLYTLSVVADRAVGKELFGSLHDYEVLCPGRIRWIGAEDMDQKTLARGLGGSFLVVENPYYCKTV